jgi:hypothetical protein
VTNSERISLSTIEESILTNWRFQGAGSEPIATSCGKGAIALPDNSRRDFSDAERESGIRIAEIFEEKPIWTGLYESFRDMLFTGGRHDHRRS